MDSTGQLFHDGGGEGRLDLLAHLVRDESAQDLLEYRCSPRSSASPAGRC